MASSPGHAGTPKPYTMPNGYTPLGFYAFFRLQVSPGALQCWQLKTNRTLKSTHPNFYRLVINFSGAKEARMLWMRELMATLNGRPEKSVYLRQLPQFRGLQESY